jgi:phosphate transport system protein
MRDTYHRRLDDLLGRLAGMCDLVGQAIREASAALLAVDAARAHEVITGDAVVDEIRAGIEREAQLLLALQAPVATDLRTLVTIVHSAENVERMGDLAHHVAVAVRRRYPESVVPPALRARFEQMGELAGHLATSVARILRTRDLALIEGLRDPEKTMDTLHRSLFAVLARRDGSFDVPIAVDAVLLSRYYERFADHALSVARRTTYLVTGEPGTRIEHLAVKNASER